MSAVETNLGYFRYDGRMCRRIASEDLTPCASGVGKDCYSDGSPTFDSF
jgi:hypothetical protein